MPRLANLPVQCPHCGFETGTCGTLGDHPHPLPGHWSLCMQCGGVSRFDEELNLQPASEEDIELLKISEPIKYAHLCGIQLGMQIRKTKTK